MSKAIKELQSPIFALCIVKDILVVAVGGGNKKCGVKNKIISFKLTDSGFSEELLSLDLENDVPCFLDPDESRSIFASCMNNFFLVYSLSQLDGNFKEIYKMETMDNFDVDKYQSVIKIKDDILFEEILQIKNGIIEDDVSDNN